MVASSGDRVRWLTVGEAARTLGMSRTTLLAAEEAGLLTPLRTPGGHRRYSPAELHRYLARGGATAPAVLPVAAVAPDPAPVDPPGLAAAARAAVRPLVHALDAEYGGLYLLRGDRLRFTAGFGVPRWLAERLAASAPPDPLVQAAGTAQHQLFDAARAGFPEPRASGPGIAAPLRTGNRTTGVLFLVRAPGRELLGGELRVVEAFRDLLATLVEDRCRIADLEQRLARIAALSTADGS
ncbi:MAG TPA: helix-turn-helix domain-containing protein [Pseudonocardia sp.]|nr:helix-turn-helix domain-containing protein [Pseudonocardia sp.]